MFFSNCIQILIRDAHLDKYKVFQLIIESYLIGVWSYWCVKTYWYNHVLNNVWKKTLTNTTYQTEGLQTLNHLFDLTSISWKSVMDLCLCPIKQRITYHCVHTCTEQTRLDIVSTRNIFLNNYIKVLCICGYTKTIWILGWKLFTSKKKICIRNYFSFRRMCPSIQDGNQTRRRH